MAPTPAKAARLRETTLARLLKQHRIRKISAETALGILRAPALTVAAGATEAAVLHLCSLIARLRLANREFRQADRKLDDLCAALTQTGTPSETAPSDAAILASLPGVGKTTLAILLTEASGPLTGRDDKALRTLSGVAPVTKRSGKSSVVVMCHAAHVRSREAVFHWARVAVQNDPKSKSHTKRRAHAAVPTAVPCAASLTNAGQARLILQPFGQQTCSCRDTHERRCPDGLAVIADDHVPAYGPRPVVETTMRAVGALHRIKQISRRLWVA
jgi:transposase